jgi:PKD repeat protein
LPVRIPGVYAVLATWYPDPANASNATYTIEHTDIGAGDLDTVVVDQRESVGFNMLGAYYFDLGSYDVQITDYADGNVVADVVMMTYVNDPQTVTRAEFSADRNSGPGPLTVQFIDQSTIYINGSFDPETTYEWDFGDGNTSTSRNPMHTYAAAGVYTVSLTVTDELGNTDSEAKESFIAVDDVLPLNAQFTANQLVGSAGSASINFLNQSTGEITELLWDFGDGSTSTEENPTHTYTGGGSFTVTLTVTGPSGSDSETETDFVYSTVGLIAVDNTFDTKPHYYRNYSGTLLGSSIMDARPVSMPNEEMRFSRFFFNGCVSEDYYLPKFTQGIVFYTIGNRDEAVDPSAEYLVEYLLGSTDDEILEVINSVNYIHGYYDFNQLPPSMR